MIDDVSKDSFIIPAMVNGKIYLSDQEINFIMGSYAMNGAGFDFKRERTIGYHLTHRKTMGLKMWEEMNLLERKQEYFLQLRRDLEIASGQMEVGKKVDYFLDRALDPMDPMNNFYKMVLIKLGATITESGAIKLSADLKEKLENWELRQKRLIDLVPMDDLEQNRKLELKELVPTLRLKPNYPRDI